MIKIGITGSLASGKTTAAKIISKNKYPIFSADKSVGEIYKNKFFLKKLIKKFHLKKNTQVKLQIKKLIINDKINLKKLENFIHPIVRVAMKNFKAKNKSKKFLIFEIPLLFESNLKKNFDLTIFISSSKKKRLNRYLKKGGNKKVFKILDKRQMKPKKKISLSDIVIKNENTLKRLKEKIKIIISEYA
jgi:dephospho-CoA kinase